MKNIPDRIQMNCIVTVEEKELFKKLAHRKEMTLSQLIRALLLDEAESVGLIDKINPEANFEDTSIESFSISA